MTAQIEPKRFDQPGIAPTPPETIEAAYRQSLLNGHYPLGDRAGLDHLVRGLGASAPGTALPELARRLLQLLVKMGGEATVRDLVKSLQEPILASAPDALMPELAQSTFELLAQLRDEPALTRYCDRALDRSAADFVAQVNDRSGGGARHVVFVADQINYKVLREALYLRKRGCRTFLLGLTAYPPEVEQAHDLAFDARLALPDNLLMLGLLLDRLTPDIYHVHCNMGRYLHGRLVIEHKGSARVVCEYNDIGSVYADRDSMCQAWGALKVDGDAAMERFILHHADGLVYQWKPAIEAELANVHGAAPPAVQFQPYPCAEFLAHSADKLSKQDGVIRFVYAGNPCPVAHNTPGGLFPGRYLPETAEALCAQGFAVDVFMDPSKFDWFHDNEGRYGLAKQRFPAFRMLKGVAPGEVSQLISRYDYGLMALKLDMSESRITAVKWRNEMANKFFAYLEAGLPLLVSAELQYMAELVEEWGIGIVASSDELPRIAARVQAFDYDRAAANVQRFNAAHMMDRQIDRLIALYDRITRPPQR
jgi:hypothetical protein